MNVLFGAQTFPAGLKGREYRALSSRTNVRDLGPDASGRTERLEMRNFRPC